MRAALVGSGAWGRELMAGAARTSSLEIVAVVDPWLHELQLDSFATLPEARKAVPFEGVVIATPNHLHRESALEAASLGLHAFVEKPIASTVAEAMEMGAAFEEAGLILMAGHNTRRQGGHRWLKKIVDEGTLGTLVSAEAHFSHPGHFSQTADSWRSNPDLCPAVGLTQLGVHMADLLAWLLGPAEEVKSLFASPAASGGVQDSTHALIRFAGGCVASLSSNYTTPFVFRITLYGVEGVAEVRQGEACRLALKDSRVERFDLPAGDTIAEELEEFARCCQRRVPPETGWKEGAAALAIIEAALHQAPEKGQTPAWPPLQPPRG